MKRKKTTGAALDSELFRFAAESLSPKSEEIDGLPPRPTKLKKLLVALDAFQKSKAAKINWRKIARFAALDLKAYRDDIDLAAATAQKQFFVDLGKCVSQEMKSGYDKLDLDLARIFFHNPSISSTEGARELVRLGHPEITPDNFRMRKKRLKALGYAVKEHHRAHGLELDKFTKAALAAHRQYP
jgi:hypothetical protein